MSQDTKEVKRLTTTKLPSNFVNFEIVICLKIIAITRFLDIEIALYSSVNFAQKTLDTLERGTAWELSRRFLNNSDNISSLQQNSEKRPQSHT